MKYANRYQISLSPRLPNIWDLLALAIIFGLIAAIAWATLQMTTPYKVGDVIIISLDPQNLPRYSLSTILRMIIAMCFSFIFTFTVAPLAAKNKTAEKFIIPCIDILQSIPILGILSITYVGFIKIFPNSRLGPECAAIFAIFTSQVWNMVLSLYQSLKTTPYDLIEAGKMLQLSSWQCFWRIEAPFSARALIWNTMISMSAGWFFVVESESIDIASQTINLPGLGSYMAKAIDEANLSALSYAVIAMLIVILIYDQIIFRPVLAWAEKFRIDVDPDDSAALEYESWFFDLLAKTRLLKLFSAIIQTVMHKFVNFRFRTQDNNINISNFNILYHLIWYAILIASSAFCIYLSINVFKQSPVPLTEIMHIIYLGFLTAIKVIILVLIASIIWIPIGIWIGLTPTAAKFFQPTIQFLAAFPANCLFPFAAMLIYQYNLNKTIWTMPLMILGTQWYILFNVIAGAASIPKEIRLVAKNFQLNGYMWWRKLALPAIFPYYITGAMTAAGGSWNASIVAEFVSWGNKEIIVDGIGSYIKLSTINGDFIRLTLGIIVMSLYVLLLSEILWKRLYKYAESRFSFGIN